MARTRIWAGCGRFVAVLANGAIGPVAMGFLAAGCGMDLETGYKYRPLDASGAQRKAYYASPFSPEKSAAESEKHSGSGVKAPGVQP